MIPIFAELPFADPRLRPVVTIGKTEPHSGMRHGMDDYGRGPDELVASVNSANEDADAPETDEWAIKVAAELTQQAREGGPRCFNVSGQYAQKYLEGAWSSLDPYIEAVRRPMSLLPTDALLMPQDSVWCNCEVPVSGQARAAAMRALIDGRVFNRDGLDPALACTWAFAGKVALPDKPVKMDRAFGACDGRTSYVPAMLEPSIDPTAHVQWIDTAMQSAIDGGYRLFVHIKGGRGFDGVTPYGDAHIVAWWKIVEMIHARAANIHAVLVYNIYGQGNKIILQEIDGVKRAADDAAVIAAFGLADADRRGG